MISIILSIIGITAAVGALIAHVLYRKATKEELDHNTFARNMEKDGRKKAQKRLYALRKTLVKVSQLQRIEDTEVYDGEVYLLNVDPYIHGDFEQKFKIVNNTVGEVLERRLKRIDKQIADISSKSVSTMKDVEENEGKRKALEQEKKDIEEFMEVAKNVALNRFDKIVEEEE